jgi:hypothetical protein
MCVLCACCMQVLSACVCVCVRVRVRVRVIVRMAHMRPTRTGPQTSNAAQGVGCARQRRQREVGPGHQEELRPTLHSPLPLKNGRLFVLYDRHCSVQSTAQQAGKF